MRYIYGIGAAVLAGLGYLFGFQAGIIWSLLVAAAIGGWTIYHRIKPGVQTFDRAAWRLPVFVLIGGFAVGLALRYALFGTISFVTAGLSLF